MEVLFIVQRKFNSYSPMIGDEDRPWIEDLSFPTLSEAKIHILNEEAQSCNHEHRVMKKSFTEEVV